MPRSRLVATASCESEVVALSTARSNARANLESVVPDRFRGSCIERTWTVERFLRQRKMRRRNSAVIVEQRTSRYLAAAG